MKRLIGLKGIALTVVSLLTLAGGCSSESTAPKMKKLEGRVVKVDPGSGIVTGQFDIKGQGAPIELSGKLAPDAEILINGVTASLKDVHPDDRVTVIGWEEKRNGERKLIARRVEITRPTGSQPSSQPEFTPPPSK
jgi:hypothetical protein